MLGFLGLGRRWSGGLYFGPAGWHPAPMADEVREATPPPPGALPGDPEQLARLLEELELAQTSPITPGLAEQLRDLGSPAGRRIRTVVMNLLPTQPESALPGAMVRYFGSDVLAGLQLITRCVRPRRALAVLDRHEFRTRRAWRRLRRKTSFGTARLINTYPQSHPTLLLRTLFGKKLRPGSLPTRANRLLVDPVTCWALGQFVRVGAAPTCRPTQVFVQDAPPRLVMAGIGERIGALCERLKIETEGRQIIRNGMLAGEPVDAGATATWATEMISIRPQPRPEPSSPCIQCGWCVDHCPTALTPVRLYELALLKRRPVEAADAAFCVGCGLCSYVCPTRLPLRAQILSLRKEVATPPPLPKGKGRADD